MKIIILGPPGSGKGTQSSLLVNKKSFFKISPGDLLRLELAKESKLADKIRTYIDSGLLINDEIIFDLITCYLTMENILFDGYPRTVNQALFLASKGIKIDLIIDINTSFFRILKRMKYRMISKSDNVLDLLNTKCGSIRYKDDTSGIKFFKRTDDKYSIIHNRFYDYYDKHDKIIDYYVKSNTLILNVDGNQDINSVYMYIETFINKFFNKHE